MTDPNPVEEIERLYEAEFAAAVTPTMLRNLDDAAEMLERAQTMVRAARELTEPALAAYERGGGRLRRCGPRLGGRR